jgi:hypothetical protein
MATAGIACLAAAAISSLVLTVESSVEYSVWTCKWTKESVDMMDDAGRSLVGKIRLAIHECAQQLLFWPCNG